MKTLMTALAMVATAPPVPAAHLPGVSDRETTITAPVVQFERGHGDVVFARDRFERWYRVQLNPGCSRGAFWVDSAVFEADRATGQIDTFSRVHFPRDGRSCAIDSIRLSAAPPQQNSRSPVTLD